MSKAVPKSPTKGSAKSCPKGCALPRSVFPLKFRVRSAAHALELARDLIRPFKNWIVGDFAAGYADDNIDPKSPQAEAFCALGALMRVNSRHEKTAHRFLKEAAARMNRPDADLKRFPPKNDDIFQVNDQGRYEAVHARVLQMFGEAIKKAKRAQRGR